MTNDVTNPSDGHPMHPRPMRWRFPTRASEPPPPGACRNGPSCSPARGASYWRRTSTGFSPASQAVGDLGVPPVVDTEPLRELQPRSGGSPPRADQAAYDIRNPQAPDTDMPRGSVDPRTGGCCSPTSLTSDGPGRGATFLPKSGGWKGLGSSRPGSTGRSTSTGTAKSWSNQLDRDHARGCRRVPG